MERSMGINEKYERGITHLNSGENKEAVKWFKVASLEGHPGAQFNLGYCYYYGKGVDQNLENAAKWYGQAAQQNHAGAQFLLSLCYQLGEGVEQNFEEASKLLIKAGCPRLGDYIDYLFE